MNKEMKLMAYGRPHILVVDRMGNARVFGLKYGMEASFESTAGAAAGDFTGYKLTFTGEEPLQANFVASPTSADPFDGMSSATVTIVAAV